MSGEASELGNDEVCVLSKFKDNTDAMGLDDTKAPLFHTTEQANGFGC